MHGFRRMAVPLAAALALVACSNNAQDSGDAAPATTVASISLPQALDNADGEQTIAEAIKDTGLQGIFEGKGSYTLLAPHDDAFDALGESGKELTRSDGRPALAALLRDHLITGYLTPQDIGAAISASGNGRVTMRTLGGADLIFSKDGDAITVTAPDGAQASIIENGSISAGGSIAIPVDAILRKL